MAFQYSAAARNAALDAIESTIGASPTLEIRTGAAPANCAAADTGTVLAILPLPADWMAAAAAGVKALLGTWQDTSADAAGTAGHFRIKQGATCHLQGSVSGANLSLVTNAITAANGNVLNFASTTGVVVGQMISGAGIPAGAQVLAVTATTVTMSLASVAGVASGAAIAFGGDITLNNNVLAIGQVVSITAFSMTAGGA
jgi:hypothetical protein